MTTELRHYLTHSQIRDHLKNTYSAVVESIEELDLNVYQINVSCDTAGTEGRKEQNWVARIYPSTNISANDNSGNDTSSIVTSLTHLLEYLQEKGFPVERCISNPVSLIHVENSGDCHVMLLTEFVAGHKMENTEKSFLYLGKLLGQLHMTPTPAATQGLTIPHGGAWHHLSLSGGPEVELSTCRSILESKVNDSTCGEAEKNGIISLQSKLTLLEDLIKSRASLLPSCIIHPDFVPANIIVHDNKNHGNANLDESGDISVTVVDWTGSGIGPRVASLGFLLCIAAISGQPGAINSVMEGYSSQVTQLEDAELEIMAKIVIVRMFAIRCWEVAMSRRTAESAIRSLKKMLKLGEDISKQVVAFYNRVSSNES